jgi:hypothetical protein
VKTLILDSFVEKYFGPLLMWVIAFFSPIQSFILATGILVACDMIIALVGVTKVEGWKGIQSSKLFRSVGKFVVYGVALIVAQVFSIYYFQNFPAVQLVAGLIAFIEVKSIDEKIEKITGHSILGMLIDKLKSKK